ncbi:MAG: ABC transporter substrate-binding protein [Deltaproteobacteria bacterium]|nr:ABC transporter substrate-binding protein [Deltaproteobacteria bacterium]
MTKIRWGFVAVVFTVLAALLPPHASAKDSKILYIGGSFALTGAYAENVAACLAGFKDYAKYVNETKRLAPWRDAKFPSDISVELLWRDDELKPPKALSIYEELKAKGMLVFQVSGSPQALALKDRLSEDSMGTVSFASGAYLLKPPQTIFTHYPIYTDSLAAVADWFMENWKGKRKPRVAYLTADNAMGRSIVVPELTNYLKNAGYDFVGTQFVPVVPTTPPTTQLMWLKKKKVDLALGVMINPGAQPTIKEAVRLGMGHDLHYKITFGFGPACPVSVFVRDMGKLGNGVLIAGVQPTWDRDLSGVNFGTELQKKYHPQKWVSDTSYFSGLAEVMTQVEAFRLALEKVPFEKLTPRAVLENGFYRIKNLDTGGLTSTPLTYGVGDVEGVDGVGLDRVQGGKAVRLGVWPCRHLY